MTDYKALYEQQLKENEELKWLVAYQEHEVCRYSNAIEQEYVLKTDYDELQEENKKLQEALEMQKKVSFWRMCETHNGFPSISDINLRDPEWIEEMNAMIEDRQESMWCQGTVKELQEGYLEFVGGYETEDEDEVVDTATVKEQLKKGIIVVCD